MTDDGDVLDASGKDIGDVTKGDRFNVEPDQPAHPYRHRYHGTVGDGDLTGYVDQDKLHRTGSVCA
ncbi:hypothetical protein AB0I49_07325 [Streptomyces sp. NPDC050617]|uniref:hypothetical protein n=1 Tax=Streptomyces sp. NPDC050617 TaxID=3154628 RepID=UPI003449AD0B